MATSSMGRGVRPKANVPSEKQTQRCPADGEHSTVFTGGRANGYSDELMQALPAAIYTTDAEGRITSYNEAAAALWGWRPELGKAEFCGSWKLYHRDGTAMSHDQCPMALAVSARRPIREMEAVAERPDGTRVPFIAYPTPLFDSSGAMVGAINMLVDISDRRRAEEVLAKHVSEQAALYQFTDKLFRAETVDDVYEAALDAILRALGCARASILLFDESGVMRFIASRGLSDVYRQAVEGHSPWSTDTKDPQPVCIDDIDSAEIDPSLKGIVRAEGIRALAFIPLVAKGQLIGKFMAYYDTPHVFSVADVNLAVTIARQLGFSLERMRTEKARRSAEQTRELLLGEIKHRIKNSLSTVQSIAQQTFRQAPSEELNSFKARLQALANTHDLLTHHNWQAALVPELVQRTVAPFQGTDGKRFSIGGPAASLDSSKSQLLALALHELATNAAKYGALSNATGRINLSWEIVGDVEARRLKFRWDESGGPPVRPPLRKGFGSLLIERVLEGEPGSARFDYRPEGLRCTFKMTL